MTYEFAYMMHLAGCAALGKEPQPPVQPVDWDQVLAFANEQTVLPLVQYAMSKAAFSIPEDYRTRAESAMRSLAYVGVVRRTGVLKILKECADEGLKVVVFKGFAVARDYAVPDVRISCDADLWVEESDEDRVLEIFHRNGFQGEKRTREDNHTVLNHPRLGVVEIHVQLFKLNILEIWYQGHELERKEPIRLLKDPDGAYYTWGVTDHFLFVLQHMMKHFIKDGLSLRMILDVGILLRTHMDELDHKRIAVVLEQRKYTQAIRVLLSVLWNFCGLSFGPCPWLKDILPIEDSAVQMVVSDMERGGVRGMKEDSEVRRDGWRIYNADLQKKQMRPTQFWLYMRLQKLRSLFSLAFPSLKNMKQKYKWVGKAPFLYPIAWIHRAFSRGLYHKRKQDNCLKGASFLLDVDSARETSGTKRVELFQTLDLM